MVNPYEAENTNKLLKHVVEETEKINREDDRIFYGIMGIIVVMLINIVLFMANAKGQKHVYVIIISAPWALPSGLPV